MTASQTSPWDTVTHNVNMWWLSPPATSLWFPPCPKMTFSILQRTCLLCYIWLRRLWVDKLVSLPLLWWISPCMMSEHQCKMVSLKRRLCSLILNDWHPNLTFTIDVLDSWKHYCYQTQFKLASCTFGQLSLGIRTKKYITKQQNAPKNGAQTPPAADAFFKRCWKGFSFL